MKKCNKCLEEKDLSEFRQVKYNKSGYYSICKKCESEKKKKHRLDNKELYSKRRHGYYLKNKIKERNYNKNYIVNNKEKLSEYFKEYRLKNKDKLKDKRNKWILENPNYIKDYRENHKEYFKKKKKQYTSSEKGKSTKRNWCNKFNKENPHIMAWRSLLQNSLKRLNTKKENHTIELLGYSALELRENMISKFTIGMNWENYGEWHIDHNKPVSSFDKNESLKIVNDLSNLKPMWATTREIDGVVYEGNLNKGKKIE